MRRTFISALLLLAASCSGDPVATPSPSSSPAKPPTATLLIENATMTQGASNATVVGFGSASESATIIVKHPGDTHIDVYALETPDSAIPAAGCPINTSRNAPKHCVRDIGAGVRETVQAPGRLGAIGLVLRSGPPGVSIRIDFDEADRKVVLKLATLAPLPGASACKDNGCNPFMEIMPIRSGTLSARATFASGLGHLQLQLGRVIAKSLSGTGIPYKIPAEKIGPSPLAITSHIDAPAEYALAFLNRDPSNPVEQIRIDATWP